MLRRLMELILPVEQQVYGATLDPTPTLGPPPSPQFNVEILARGGWQVLESILPVNIVLGGRGLQLHEAP